MSVQTEIDRIITAVGAAYDAVEQKGGTVPQSETVAGLAEAIGSIPLGGTAGGVNVSYDTVEPNRYSVDLDNHTAQLNLTGLVAGSHYICSIYFSGQSLDPTNDNIGDFNADYNITVYSIGSEQSDNINYSGQTFFTAIPITDNSNLVLNLDEFLSLTKNDYDIGMAYYITEVVASIIVSWD